MRNRFSADHQHLLTCGNVLLDKILFDIPKTILLYGEAAVGKTNIVLDIIKRSIRALELNNMIAVYVSTEGSCYVDRVIQLGIESANIVFVEAYSLDHTLHLVSYIFATIPRIALLAIDSINNFYRAEAGDVRSSIVFSSILTILKALAAAYNVYIIATAQVRQQELGEVEPSGIKFLVEWADVIARIERRGRLRKFIVEKPVSREFEFVIHDCGIEWILEEQ